MYGDLQSPECHSATGPRRDASILVSRGAGSSRRLTAARTFRFAIRCLRGRWPVITRPVRHLPAADGDDRLRPAPAFPHGRRDRSKPNKVTEKVCSTPSLDGVPRDVRCPSRCGVSLYVRRGSRVAPGRYLVERMIRRLSRGDGATQRQCFARRGRRHGSFGRPLGAAALAPVVAVEGDPGSPARRGDAPAPGSRQLCRGGGRATRGRISAAGTLDVILIKIRCRRCRGAARPTGGRRSPGPGCCRRTGIFWQGHDLPPDRRPRLPPQLFDASTPTTRHSSEKPAYRVSDAFGTAEGRRAPARSRTACKRAGPAQGLAAGIPWDEFRVGADRRSIGKSPSQPANWPNVRRLKWQGKRDAASLPRPS